MDLEGGVPVPGRPSLRGQPPSPTSSGLRLRDLRQRPHSGGRAADGHMKPHTFSNTVCVWDGDIIIVLPGGELEAQREGGVPLDLLGESDWPLGCVGAVTFPAFEGLGGLIAAFVALTFHHVEEEALGVLGGDPAVVVRTVDVQVVVDLHPHRIILQEPAGRGDG